MIGGSEMPDNENDLFLRECKALVGWFDCRRGQTLKLNDNGINTVIRALQEVQEYREICSPEELKEIMPSLTKYVDDLFSKFSESGFTEKFMEISESALEEFKRYRSIGTVEECNIYKSIAEKAFSAGCLDMKIVDELHEYKSIGTVEEFREAAEIQRAKKPVKYDNCGNKSATDRCPNCFEIISGNHCENCGQAISWEESEGEDD